MSVPSLDRILTTCVRREADALLVVGSPPLMKMKDGSLRCVELPPLTTEQLAALIREIQSIQTPAESCGYAYVDINYRNECDFRFALFANVSPPAVLCTRLDTQTRGENPPTPPPPIYPIE